MKTLSPYVLGVATGVVICLMSAMSVTIWDALHPAATPEQWIETDPGTTTYNKNVYNATYLGVTESEHGEGKDSRGFCFDNSSVPVRRVNCTYNVSPDGTVAFYWWPPFTGRIVIAPKLKSQ